jgi:hypothetical protein
MDAKLVNHISADDHWIREAADRITATACAARCPSGHVVSDLINTFNNERQDRNRLKGILRVATFLVAR